VKPGWRLPPFTATIDRIPADHATQMIGRSWHTGCPVPVTDLRLIRMTFWGFDHATHDGELIVHADVAEATVRAFHRAYDAGLQIRSMRPVDAYDGGVRASKEADNTAGFACEAATDAAAYGRSVDINPVENPSVLGTTVSPAAGSAYLERTKVRPGMIVAHDAVTAAFAAERFTWGGERAAPTAYQRFEVPAR
jgi:hypothetical protein